ncbi:hypothetical protein CCACVL1_22666, partial [Corchorus capsularis]
MNLAMFDFESRVKSLNRRTRSQTLNLLLNPSDYVLDFSCSRK